MDLHFFLSSFLFTVSLLDSVLVKAAAYGQDLSIEKSDESLSAFSSPIDTTATIPQDTTANIAIKNGIESVVVMSHGNYGQIQTLSYLLCLLFGIMIIQG